MEKQPDKTPMKSLRDAYRVSGFRVQARIDSYDELDHPAFVVTLDRRSKKGVRRVRESVPQALRQALATGARPWMRRSGSLSRLSDASRDMHGLRREERETCLSVGEHEIHVAVCHADWRFVSRDDDHGCGATDASRLAHRQGPR